MKKGLKLLTPGVMCIAYASMAVFYTLRVLQILGVL